MYAAPCHDVPGSVASWEESSTQLPISLPGCYRKDDILPRGSPGTMRDGAPHSRARHRELLVEPASSALDVFDLEA
jgi:hypothetical protein